MYSYNIHYNFTINLCIHLFFSTVHSHYSSISDPYILQNKLKSEVYRGNKVISHCYHDFTYCGSSSTGLR